MHYLKGLQSTRINKWDKCQTTNKPVAIVVVVPVAVVEAAAAYQRLFVADTHKETAD